MPHQSSPAPYLVMMRGAQPFRFFPLNKSVITLGRAPNNDIVILDRSVSRYHARLLFQNGQWVIEDLGSDNGIWINGVRIAAPTILVDDIIFALGSSVRFEMEMWPDPPPNVPKRRLFPKWLAPAGLLGLGVSGLVIAGLVLLAILGVLAYFAFGWGGGTPWIQIDYGQESSSEELQSEAAPPDQISVVETSADLPPAGPEVVIIDLDPALHIPLGGAFDVQASAYDDDGVVRMELWVDAQLAFMQVSPTPEGSAPFLLDQSLLGTSEGTFSVVVRAYDSLGNMGESMAYHVTVIEGFKSEPRDVPVQYPLDEGDTLQSVSQQTGFSVQQIQEANPNLSQLGADEPILNLPDPAAGNDALIGVILVLPNLPDLGGLPPQLPPPDQIPLVGLNPVMPMNLNQVGPDAQPDQLPGQVLPVFFPNPASLPNLAQMPKPGGLNVDINDCKVVFSWQFSSPEAENMVIYRRAVPGEIKPQLVATLPATATSYTDPVPPGMYEYAVEAVSKKVNNAVERVRSDPYSVKVAPTTDCIKYPEKFKLILFQPLSFNPHKPGIVRANIYYRLWGPTFRRLPMKYGEYFATGKMNYPVEAFPYPPILYLNPDQSFMFEVEGRGLTLDEYVDGLSAQKMYSSQAIINSNELNNGGKKEWLAQGGQFSLVFKMWSEEHRWTGSGWGTANQKGRIPAPTNLRTSEYRPGLMKLKYDWNGDEDQIEGFILYRSYNCPGRGDVIRAPLYSYGVDRHVYYSPWNEPAGCAYRYTMTAFGRYGESAPSQPLLGTTQSTFQAARVIFHKLKIHSLPDGSATGDIRLSVGPDHHTGSLWLQKKEYALDNLAMDGMIPNNRFGLILEKNADASIGFSVEMYDDQNRFDGDVCYGYISIKEEDLKKLTNTINHTISDTDNRCTVTLSITGLPDYSPPAGSRIMPQTDLYISKAYRTGYRVYAYVRRDYGDELDDARFLVQSSWGEYCESKPPLIYGTAERWVQGGGGYPPGLYYLDPKVDAFVNMVQTHPEKYSACPMKLLLRVTEGKPGDNPTFIDIDEANNENLIEISKIH